MGERVTIPATGHQAVVALPSGTGKHPAVIVLQEYWGINEQIEGIARKWAEAGFVAVVPDLYHGKLATSAEEAGKLMKQLDFAKAVQEIAAAVEWARGHQRSTGKVAVTGYCMGGALSFATAVNVRGLAAVAPFYGVPGDLDWTKIDAPVQAHFAKHDEWATVTAGEHIKAAVQVPMELYVYDAKHAFCNERRPEVYHAEAARQAWDRTLAFIRRHTV